MWDANFILATGIIHSDCRAEAWLDFAQNVADGIRKTDAFLRAFDSFDDGRQVDVAIAIYRRVGVTFECDGDEEAGVADGLAMRRALRELRAGREAEALIWLRRALNDEPGFVAAEKYQAWRGKRP
ncbi:MAG: hypothetical protein NW215_10615 [Hyphomicrobiales bacterium]|nr:hypothetical protein [Hyphomicrobiales bacterium]